MQRKAKIKQDNIFIAMGYKINNLYYFNKYIVDIILLIIDFLSNINTELTIPKPRNNNVLKEAQNGETIDIENTKASFINKKNAEAFAKKFANLYQQIYKRLKYFGKAKIKLLYKFIYKIPKIK